MAITSYIKHLAVSGLLSISARIKSTCNLTGKCFEMPNVSYTNRYGAIWKKTAIQLKINIPGFKMCLKQNVSTKKKK